MRRNPPAPARGETRVLLDRLQRLMERRISDDRIDAEFDHVIECECGIRELLPEQMDRIALHVDRLVRRRIGDEVADRHHPRSSLPCIVHRQHLDAAAQRQLVVRRDCDARLAPCGHDGVAHRGLDTFLQQNRRRRRVGDAIEANVAIARGHVREVASGGDEERIVRGRRGRCGRAGHEEGARGAEEREAGDAGSFEQKGVHGNGAAGVTLRDESRKAKVCRADLRANMRRVLKMRRLRGIGIQTEGCFQAMRGIRGEPVVRRQCASSVSQSSERLIALGVFLQLFFG
ncbi:hypothetical protein PCAR4_260061 [Paraburkholderia caribensis]|nr:hypothetical protein PCAR4_260061 [Paraburkholderia caribensis]